MYDTLITTKRPTITVEGAGHSKTFNNYLILSGVEVQPLSQIENVNAGRKTSAQTIKVYIKNTNTDVEMTDRIYYDKKNWEIVEKQVFKSAYIKLICNVIIK